MKYQPGKKLIFIENQVEGVIIPNYKLPGDVCIRWETGLEASYDIEWLDKLCKIKE